MSQHEKIGIITGASGGIGFAIAKQLALKVKTLIVTGRSEEKLNRVKQAIEGAAGCEVRIYKLDLENEEEILRFSEVVNQSIEGLTYLVHCAGVIYTGPLHTMTTEIFDTIYKVNARAPFILTKALLPKLKNCTGQIVFTNSSVIRNSYLERGLYAYSKIALKGIADVLRQELNPSGIRVISIFPGQTNTQMQKKLYQDLGKSYLPDLLIQPEDVANTVVHALEMASTVEVSDIYLRPMKKGA